MRIQSQGRVYLGRIAAQLALDDVLALLDSLLGVVIKVVIKQVRRVLVHHVHHDQMVVVGDRSVCSCRNHITKLRAHGL